MELTALTGITPQAAGTAAINKKTDTNATGFDAILQQAMNMVSETNDYQNAAESAVHADAAQQVAGAQLDASEQAVFCFAVNCIIVRTSLK